MLLAAINTTSSDEFSGDEVFAFLVGLALAARFLWIWYRPLFFRDGLRFPAAWLLPGLLVVPLAVVLNRYADPVYVVGHSGYVVLFLVCSSVAYLWSAQVGQLFGFDFQADVLHNGNRAAAVMLGCAMTAATTVYAGANIGAGPTVWTTFGPALLSLGVLTISWSVLLRVGNAADAISLDRDRATAWRVGLTLVAIALILARASAGDFQSWDHTFQDFLTDGWPALPVLAFGAALNLFLAPTPRSPQRSRLRAGLLPGGAFLLAAAAFVLSRPPPPIGKTLIPHEKYVHESSND